MKNIAIWLKGLLVAAIGGASPVLVGVFASPETLMNVNWKVLGFQALAGAGIGVLMYLKQSPVSGSKIDPIVPQIPITKDEVYPVT